MCRKVQEKELPSQNVCVVPQSRVLIGGYRCSFVPLFRRTRTRGREILDMTVGVNWLLATVFTLNLHAS